MKWLTLAWRNVLRNKRRTALAASIIGAGVVALLISIGFVLASFDGLRESTINSQVGHLQIGKKGQFDALEETPLQLGLTRDEASRIQDEVARMPGARFSMRRLAFEGLISNGDRTVVFTGTGIEPDKEQRLSAVFAPIAAGEGLPGKESDDQYRVLLGVDLAANLGARPGDKLTVLATTAKNTLNAVDVTLAGTYHTGVPELDRRALMVPIEVAQSILDTDKVSRVVVSLKRTDETDRAMGSLAAALPGFDIKRWIDLAPFYRQVVILYRNIFSVLGIIIVLVVLLSASNSMLMTIMERVREIGTMRAFGISALRVRVNFLLEGGLIGALGGIAGLASAAVIALAINLAHIQMPPPPGRSSSYPLIVYIDWRFDLAVLLGIVAVGALAAWLPTRLSRRLTIVEELNHV